MKEFWKDCLQESELFCNLQIICSDGRINSHKIVIACVSDFIKSIILSIPVGDHVTLLLPDFSKCDIEAVIDLTKMSNKENDIFDGINDEYKNLHDEELKLCQKYLKQEFDEENYHKNELHSQIEEEHKNSYLTELSSSYVGIKRQKIEKNRKLKLEMKIAMEQAKSYLLLFDWKVWQC